MPTSNGSLFITTKAKDTHRYSCHVHLRMNMAQKQKSPSVQLSQLSKSTVTFLKPKLSDTRGSHIGITDSGN